MDHDEQPRDELYRIRHSLAHVLAQAVLQLRPGSTLGFGPPIDDGFYYDFILSAPLSEDDFPELEKRMKHILKQGQTFEREELGAADALARIDGMNEPYKREYAQELIEKRGLPGLSFYKNGPFLDMCEGPHVENTRKIPEGCYKLRSIAGAYWRGDSRNAMMTRIYAWAFASKEELDAKVKAYREALARDHKKLGRELDIYVIDDEIGKGLPLWLPAGTVLRDELEKLAKELEFKDGYQRVATPHLNKVELFYKTGHLPYYAPHMYPVMELKETVTDASGSHEVVKEAYCLKPMNCPHHHRIFAARMRSYRDLPIRLAEYGQVYRFEDAGALSGLLRVRGMCMNDAHIYCTEEQIEDEFLKVMDLHRRVYEILGLSSYHLRFSTWDPEDPKGKEKYVDNPEAWARTEALVHRAMIKSGLPFTEGKGEAAFYGPKIDMQFKTVTGREETASTNQLDFAVPERLGLKYIGADNKEHTPYCIHRAPLGTHERFIAFLIEHYGGAFPTWLAPLQVRVITVADAFNEYGSKLVATLRDKFVRAELESSHETLNKKVRNAVTEKIPNVLVIGEREAADGTVTLRRYGDPKQETMPFAEFERRLHAAIASRSRDLPA
ncbi:MAG: threonine--tRNA ligase [Deltaproteobacteria bacterium]|nr:threonine--tRNA ligase [Deltaproteobacteria bacterium]MBK8234166.1 threonine--tRNA ligase [Deltaproteobacteria bacterium]MBK8714894.1 threonine--tRNA ligase [Deltaproteobacteria bacterium]MBP7287424.1 threonine--tRNA ligase [Nannocystaceae bacterium]